MTRRNERGNVAVVVALSITFLLGFAALVIDFGNIWKVKDELQNAADAAALGGVRDLNGLAEQEPVAREAAQRLAALHLADGTPVLVDENLANAPAGDIVLGHWSFPARAFTPDDGTMPSYKVNAVEVRTRRTAQTGNPVHTFLAPLFGRATQDLVTAAIAVGGSPAGTCAFPLAVTDCSIIGDDGNIRCNQTLTFGQATTDTVGFTVLSDSNPTTPSVTCMIARTLGSPCPTNCDCSNTCNATSIDDGSVKISNGNNLSQTSVDDINAAVAASGDGGFDVAVPVIDSGGLSASSCTSFNYNQPREIVGYVTMKITGASFAPDKAVYAEIDCTESGPIQPGGDFFGYKSTNVYLVR